MMTPLVLCLYLLLLVIDVVVGGVWWGSAELIWLGGFHLLMFLIGITIFRHEFAALAEKYQTRVVFNARVYGFFALASGLFLSAVVFSGSFLTFFARGVLISLLVFWTGVQLFDFFPVRTRQVQRLVFWNVLAGFVAFSILAWGSLRGLFGTLGEQNPLVGAPYEDSADVVNSDTESGSLDQSGVSLQEIRDMGTTGSAEGTGEIEVSTGSVQDEPILEIQSGVPITYRILLPYFDQQGLLPAVGQTPPFTNLTTQDPLYPSFQRAWGLKMVGTNINPDRQVRCENFMVLLGLAQGWSVSTSLPVLDAYWQAATTRDVLGSCLTRDQVATQDMLTSVQ